MIARVRRGEGENGASTVGCDRIVLCPTGVVIAFSAELVKGLAKLWLAWGGGWEHWAMAAAAMAIAAVLGGRLLKHLRNNHSIRRQWGRPVGFCHPAVVLMAAAQMATVSATVGLLLKHGRPEYVVLSLAESVLFALFVYKLAGKRKRPGRVGGRPTTPANTLQYARHLGRRA